MYELIVTDTNGEPVTTMQIPERMFLETLGIFGRLDGFPLKVRVVQGEEDKTAYFRTMLRQGREMFAPAEEHGG